MKLKLRPEPVIRKELMKPQKAELSIDINSLRWLNEEQCEALAKSKYMDLFKLSPVPVDAP